MNLPHHLYPSRPLRLLLHAVALVFLTGGVLLTASGAPSVSATAHATGQQALVGDGRGTQGPDRAASGTSSPAPATAGTAQTPGSTAAPLNVEGALPAWVMTTRPTTLLKASADGAPVFLSVPAGTPLRAIGPVQNNRLAIYSPGNAALTGAGPGWADVDALTASVTPVWVGTTPGVDAASAGDLPPGLSRPPRRVGGDAPPPVSARTVAIVDEGSSLLLYGDKPYDHVPQASTTKVITTLVALERAPDLSQQITTTVSATEMVNRDGSSTMGIEPDDHVMLETLLWGMMLPSGNDAAEQIAVSMGGTRDRYIGWMNDEVTALGLHDTHFTSPSGMDTPGHYSSAYDMAIFSRFAMRNDFFRKLASTERMVMDDYYMHNANRFLPAYPEADGVKIGYTDDAGKTIVASATHNGHRVYVSLMHSDDLVADPTALFDWVWQTFSWD